MAGISDEVVLAHHHTHTAADMMIRLPTDTAGVVDLLIIATAVAGTLAMTGPNNQIYRNREFAIVKGGTGAVPRYGNNARNGDVNLNRPPMPSTANRISSAPLSSNLASRSRHRARPKKQKRENAYHFLLYV